MEIMSESRHISVLVVEDDQTHRELVADRLSGEEPGFDVSFAASCTEAIQQLAERAFECVVLDHNLPDGTGDEFMSQAHYHLLTTPVVAFSTSIDPDVMISEFKGGCVDFIPKREAFSGDLLPRTILKAVENFRVRAAVERAGSSVRLIEQAGKLLASESGAAAAGRPSIQNKLQLIYETAVRTSQDGVLLVERHGQVVYANPAFKRLLGLSDMLDLPGHPRTTIDDVLTPGAAANFRAHTEERASFESVLRAASGEEVPVQIGQTPLGDHGVLCAVSDLREAKARQRELEEKNRHLAELCETANRFVDNVSHEFRTPLTVIKGYSEVIENGLAGPITDEQRGFLWTILDRTRDLAQMVDDLLDTSKIRAGCLRVDRRAQRVSDILATHRPAIVQKAQTHKVNVRDEVSVDLPLVYADGEKVGRIILNLLVNAIKFSPEGAEVVIWARAEPGGDIRVGVTDNGPGIAPENLSIIFERFKQVGDPQRSSTKGFGLGLNIARELVALNLGTMSVESTLGRGSTFSFTLPPNDQVAVAARFLDRLPEFNGNPTQVALLAVTAAADDDSRDLMRQFLSSHTYPMDLIFESTEAGALLLFGHCSDAEQWAQRLRTACADASHWPHKAGPCPPRIEVLGRWPYPSRNKEALRAVSRRVSGVRSRG